MTDIRPIRGGEDEAVIALWTASDLTRPWNDPVADLNLAKDGATSTLLVAADEVGISGTVMVGFDGHRGWIYYLAVDPDRRRSGLGRDLMTAAQDWLKKRGAPKLQLMVRSDNEAALGFYHRLGLERQDVIVLGRRLDG
ncbi:GNAT family acetyltransferase [Brevundimonas intermedia]|uniref:GNAT family acetyltransferase n=1 Tax=Brevundimonas intermedia TaxID=74315 RepID=A0ABQ5T6U2_9CAUL|nr:GNAT family acetyltransferase [Brevundimonas intermedia]GLK48502.1 GNAT family acetyltransferase [Brevundimonas intermedia]